MTKLYVMSGDVLDHTPSSAVSSGQVLVLGKRVGVALGDIAANATGAVRVRGVFVLAKKSTDDMAQGALLYWDAVAGNLTTTTTSNTLAGFAATAAGSGATTVEISLNA